MDTLSPDLVRRLDVLGLCGPRDLRRCRARVRKLSRNLPAFDSVWIDALVQSRRLTSFQARLLASPNADDLAAGPFVLVDRLGGDGWLTTYRARRLRERELALLTVVHCSEEEQPAVLERLREGIARRSRCDHPHLALPQAANIDRRRLVVLAPALQGRTLSELLVRRGRLPFPVVQELARQLVSALAALEQSKSCHGDLRLKNVCLDPSGRTVLFQAGVLAAISPHVTIHSEIPPDCYDGVAPELIDGRAERNVLSDVYALGCLLWELLTGRPPFPTGDPLGKLAAHQTRSIADVRSLTPEAPQQWAELLRRMTCRDPFLRPRSFVDIGDLLGRPTSAGRRRLRQFARAFQTAAPRSTGPSEEQRRSGRKVLAAALLLLAASLGALAHSGARSELLRIAGRLQRATLPASREETRTAAVHAENDIFRPGSIPAPASSRSPQSPGGLHPLPADFQDGLLTLTHNGPFAAADLSTVGPLTIRAAQGVQPVIIVGTAPLRLVGTTVILQGLAVQRAAGPRASGAALVEVTAQDFGLVNCIFLDGEPAVALKASPLSNRGMIEWRALDEQDASGGRLGWVNTAFLGDAAALLTRTAPHRMQLTNVLKSGAGSLIDVEPGGRPRVMRMALKHVTLRECDGIVAAPASLLSGAGRLQLAVEECVFDPRSRSGLFVLRGTREAAQRVLPALSITGEESWLCAGGALAVARDASGDVQAVDAAGMSVEGLQYADLQFVGPLSSQPADAILDASSVASRSLEAPGIGGETFEGK